MAYKNKAPLGILKIIGIKIYNFPTTYSKQSMDRGRPCHSNSFAESFHRNN